MDRGGLGERGGFRLGVLESGRFFLFIEKELSFTFIVRCFLFRLVRYFFSEDRFFILVTVVLIISIIC